MKKMLQLLLCFAFANLAAAGTEMKLWHSYQHHPSGIIHYGFYIADYKRGLFFGSCGPSTRSLKWEYSFDLAGMGPVYSASQIKYSRDGEPVYPGKSPSSGQIKVDAKKKRVEIRLKILDHGIESDFQGNGTYVIRER